MSNKIINFLIVFLVGTLLSLMPAWAEAGETAGKDNHIFTDVTAEYWAYNPIKRLTELNIIRGYPDGSYRPQQKVQRKEFALMLSSIAGLHSPKLGGKPFADVPIGVWYEPAVEAVRQYIPSTIGDNGKDYFYPDAEATRQDVIFALVNALKVNYNDVDPMLLQDKFSDYQEIAADSMLQVAWAVQHNLIKGFPDKKFRPNDGISRAEVTAILYRAFFIDTSIKGLVKNKQIKPFTNNAYTYQKLAEQLNEQHGKIMLRSEEFDIKYFLQDEEIYDGEGPSLLYVFGCIDNDKYFRWGADFNSAPNTAQKFNEAVAMDISQVHPKKNVLVILGHTFNLYFDPKDIYDSKYLTIINDGWRLDRFYTGVMIKEDTIINSWVEGSLD